MNPKTPTKIRKKLWKLFSQYIRQRDKGVCFTCGIKKDWRLQNAGHFIPQSSHSDTMFSEVNVNCQCVRCNEWKHGNLGVYASKIIEKYGLDKLKELERHRDRVKIWKIPELEELIEFYKKKLRELE